MLHLKDLKRQIPNGFRFYQPETKWEAPRWMSFDSLVRQVISHRRGNAVLSRKSGLATDYANVAAEVELYNAKLCQAHGWADYISGDAGDSPPKLMPPPGTRHGVAAVGARLWAGIKTIRDILNGDPVDQTLAEKRAHICTTCPKNSMSDLTSFFTIPAAKQIRAYLIKKKEYGYSTTYDEKLGVCEACSCPLQLKVHTDIRDIRTHMNEEVKGNLDPRCWVLKEP